MASTPAPPPEMRATNSVPVCVVARQEIRPGREIGIFIPSPSVTLVPNALAVSRWGRALPGPVDSDTGRTLQAEHVSDCARYHGHGGRAVKHFRRSVGGSRRRPESNEYKSLRQERALHVSKRWRCAAKDCTFSTYRYRYFDSKGEGPRSARECDSRGNAKECNMEKRSSRGHLGVANVKCERPRRRRSCQPPPAR